MGQEKGAGNDEAPPKDLAERDASDRGALLKAVAGAVSSAASELDKATISAISLTEDSAARIEGMVSILTEVVALLRSAVLSSEMIATAISANAQEIARSASEASFAAQTVKAVA